MIKILKENYLFIILFLIIIFKNVFYNLINIKEEKYNTISCEHLKNEYNKLLEFNNINYIYNAKNINTYVIYKNIYDYKEEIIIRGGKDQNFSKYPVIYDNTLLGVIDKVYQNTSRVKLITNKNSKISVKINDEIGLLIFKNNILQVIHIPNYSNINIGDSIYTSGLGLLNENIYIGTVKNIFLNKQNIEKIIEVDYQIKIKDINYLTVMENKL